MSKFKKGDKVKRNVHLYFEQYIIETDQGDGFYGARKIANGQKYVLNEGNLEKVKEKSGYVTPEETNVTTEETETKLNYYVPSSEKLKSVTYQRRESIDYPGGTTTTIYLESKPKERSFEQYVFEYFQTTPEVETAEGLISAKGIEDKLGLLWYIVKDKGGDLNDYGNLLHFIKEKVHTLSYSKICPEMFKLLPQCFNILPKSFVESLKQE